VRRTKQEVIDDITHLVSADPLTVSIGSTEPKGVFDAVNDRLSLGIDRALTKPEYAEAIAELAGIPWDATCDSRDTASGGGSTVTITGLERVLEATRTLISRRRREAPSLGDLDDDATVGREIEAILDVLDEALPDFVDGRDAVLALKAAGGGWRQTEWPGFYLEHLAREALKARLGGDTGPRFGNTGFDYRLIRVFDLKVHSEGSGSMWLNDAEAMETAILTTGGLGFIVVAGSPVPDEDGTFRSWHDELKGTTSDYVREARARGARRRQRKAAFLRTRIDVYFIDGIERLHHGLEHGWLRLSEQGRQADGGPRQPKFQLLPSRVPSGVLVASR
jgi:hypothetical protein